MNHFLDYLEFIQKSSKNYNGIISDIRFSSHEDEASTILLKASNSYRYILDYRCGRYLSFSDSFKDVVNYPVDLLKKEDVHYYASLIHCQDWSVINGFVFKRICRFLARIPAEFPEKYRFIFNYRIRKPDGEYITVRQINNFLKLDKNGNPLVNAGYCTVIPYPVPNYKITYIAQTLNSHQVWENEDVKTFMPEQVLPGQLSPTEIRILQWIKIGYSSEKIAEKLNRSLHTIKTHRKNMLEKTRCKNTAELLQVSLSLGLV